MATFNYFFIVSVESQRRKSLLCLKVVQFQFAFRFVECVNKFLLPPRREIVETHDPLQTLIAFSTKDRERKKTSTELHV